MQKWRLLGFIWEFQSTRCHQYPLSTSKRNLLGWCFNDRRTTEQTGYIMVLFAENHRPRTIGHNIVHNAKNQWLRSQIYACTPESSSAQTSWRPQSNDLAQFLSNVITPKMIQVDRDGSIQKLWMTFKVFISSVAPEQQEEGQWNKKGLDIWEILNCWIKTRNMRLHN